MKKDIIEYAKGMNAQQHIIEWLDKNIQDTHNLSEVEHIIDYLVSDKAPKRLNRATYTQMKANTEKWNAALIKRGTAISEGKDDTDIVLDFARSLFSI